MTDLVNIEAERSVIGTILINPDAMADIVDWLKPEAFGDRASRAVYRAMLRLWERREPATIITVSAELMAMGGKDQTAADNFLMSCLQIDNPYFVTFHAEVIMRFARNRALWSGCESMLKTAALGGDFDAADLWAPVFRDIETFTKPGAGINTAAEQMQALRAMADDRWSGRTIERILPTKMFKVDRLLGGGLRDSQLIYLAARPGMGKSAFMNHIAANRNVAIFSLEMPWQDVRNRMVATLAGVPFETGVRAIGDVEQQARWVDASFEVETWPVHVIDNLRTTAQIESRCLRLQQEGGLDAVFIDHLGLLSDENKRGGEYERVSMISRRLKEMAMRLAIPTVCLSQLNREVESRTECIPQLSDLRDSGRIEEDADVVLMLYNRRYYVTKGMLKSGDDDFIPQTNWDRVKVKVEKNRNGEPGIADIGWEGKYMRWHDADERRAA